MEEIELRDRIPKSTAKLMLGVAGFYELIGCIPWVNIVSGIIQKGHFLLWYKMRGISISENKKMIRNMAISAIIELIPIVSILPSALLQVFIDIKTIQMEDAAFNKEAEEKNKQIRLRNRQRALETLRRQQEEEVETEREESSMRISGANDNENTKEESTSPRTPIKLRKAA